MLIPDPREKPTLTVQEAAELLGVSPDTVYDAIKTDTFVVAPLRLGRRIVIPTQPLLDLLGLGARDAERQAEYDDVQAIKRGDVPLVPIEDVLDG